MGENVIEPSEPALERGRRPELRDDLLGLPDVANRRRRRGALVLDRAHLGVELGLDVGEREAGGEVLKQSADHRGAHVTEPRRRRRHRAPDELLPEALVLRRAERLVQSEQPRRDADALLRPVELTGGQQRVGMTDRIDGELREPALEDPEVLELLRHHLVGREQGVLEHQRLRGDDGEVVPDAGRAIGRVVLVAVLRGAPRQIRGQEHAGHPGLVHRLPHGVHGVLEEVRHLVRTPKQRGLGAARLNQDEPAEPVDEPPAGVAVVVLAPFGREAREEQVEQPGGVRGEDRRGGGAVRRTGGQIPEAVADRLEEDVVPLVAVVVRRERGEVRSVGVGGQRRG